MSNVFNGTTGNDVFYGTGQDDVFLSYGGTDFFYGGGGNDIFNGGSAGTLNAYGGLGNDTYVVTTLSFSCVENPNEGIDTIVVHVSAAFQLPANIENMVLLQGSSVSSGWGNDLANSILGNSNSNVLIGFGGNDTLTGGEGEDVLYGENNTEGVTGGNDILRGGGDDDVLLGEGGNDTLDGGAGGDTLRGGHGNDLYLLGADATDTIIEMSGVDTISSTITRSLVGYAQIENLTLLGTAAINGTGNNLANTILGNAKANTLRGEGGADKLNGGSGADKLYGGASNDIFIFNTALTAANRDIIYDFNLGNDTIQLENAIFTKAGPVGALKSAAFALSTATKAADDRIIYNKSTGQLFYDSDGSGAAAAILFATLQNKPTVTATDFQVI
ncbi:MAG TPA: calcium-binding protein [Rhizobiaceae bacterium]|nr:calcium-binding protein [Rhizobiaceae bacterium]